MCLVFSVVNINHIKIFFDSTQMGQSYA